MSQIYYTTEAVSRTLGLTSSSGRSIAAVAVVLDLQDGNGAVLSNTAFAIANTDVSIAYKIESSFNTLAATEMFGVRIVTFTITDDVGDTHVLKDRYFLRQVNPYTVGVDLPATIADAELAALQSGNTGFSLLSDTQKEAAMISAFGTIKNMRLKCCDYNDGAPFRIGSLSTEEYATMAAACPSLINAVLSASIIEAVHQSECGGIEDKIASGVVGFTSGSSSTFYRNEKPVVEALSAAAMRALGPYRPPAVYAIGRR